MSLLIGSVIHRYSSTSLPARAEVLARVKEIAENQGQNVVGRNFKFITNQGIIHDTALTIAQDENETALTAHPIDDEADDHNEIVQ